MYSITIKIINQKGVLLEKKIKLKQLDQILILDRPSLYAEAQQNEIVLGLDIPDQDEL